MRHYPVILSIAGSDCSGGAGIQADIKTISACGGYAASVITAVTVQNTRSVHAVHPLSARIVGEQIEAVMDDLQPEAIKIGMVDDAQLVRTIASCLRKYAPRPLVYDPVMVSTSGRRLMTDEAIAEIKKELFPLSSLITPNLDEVYVLTGRRVTSLSEMEEAARWLSETYHTAFLVKGGHLPGEEMCDVLATPRSTYIYKEQKIESKNLHGTGCTLSSSIATLLAKGVSLEKAVGRSKEYVSQAIASGRDLEIGEGNGPLWHFHPFW